jgi:UDPglucose 6-dehydrogenase
MRIAIIGTGYVGLVSGACFSDFGHEVICVDKEAAKIHARKGVMPIFEPGLDQLVARNVEGRRLGSQPTFAGAVDAPRPSSCGGNAFASWHAMPTFPMF